MVRRFRTVPVGKAVYTTFQFRGRMHPMPSSSVKIQFADEHKRYNVLSKDWFWISRHMTIQAVARHLGVSWDC
ncbi:MAG: transposase family protein [Nitrosomonas sp.]|nr:transposase family protein [Nitrosomonas sp.]